MRSTTSSLSGKALASPMTGWAHHSSGFPHVLFRKIQKLLAKFSFELLDCVARRFGIDSVRSSVGKVHRPADAAGFCDDD